jgi:hypothetical protein
MDSLAGGDAAPPSSSSSSSSSSSPSSAESTENAQSVAAPGDGDDDDGGIRVVSIVTPAREPDRPSPQEEPARLPGTRDGVGSPAAGGGAPLAAWVASALHLRHTQGLRFTENLRHNAKFQNPAVCSKMIAFCGLDEHGTNVKPGDPRASPALDPSAYYDVLAERQRILAEERAVKRQRPDSTT